jgi:hypothetical protein
MISAGMNKKQSSKNNHANNHAKSLLIYIPDLARLVPGSCSCAGSNKMVSTWVQVARTCTWNPSFNPANWIPSQTAEVPDLKIQKTVEITKNCICSSTRQNCWRHIMQWNTLVFMLSGTNACLSVSCMTITSTYHLWRVHPPNFLGCVARDWLFSPEQVFQTKKFQEVTGKSKSMKYAWQPPWLDDMTFWQSNSHQRNDWVHRGPTCLRLTPSNEKLSMPGANISCHD